MERRPVLRWPKSGIRVSRFRRREPPGGNWPACKRAGGPRKCVAKDGCRPVKLPSLHMPHAAFRALPALALCVAAGGACARRNTVEDASEPPSHEETLAEPAVRAPRSEVLVGDAT